MQQLTPLDALFLRAESPAAHMHVAWRGRFAGVSSRGLPSLAEVRRLVGCRIAAMPKLRRRPAATPLGAGEPFWIDDPGFDITRHVVAPRHTSFDAMVDAELSRPLDRSLPLWRIVLVYDEEGLGVLCKMHHALVDGVSAVEIAMMLLSNEPSGADGADQPPWQPTPAGPGARLARSLRDDAGGATRLLRRAIRTPGAVGATSAALAHTLGRAVARPAPRSGLNRPIGAGRTLGLATIAREDVLRLRRRHEVSFNDACLAIVASALGDIPGVRAQTLRTMIPVSLHRPGDDSGPAGGNQITFAFVDLPVGDHPVEGRLRAINAQTSGLRERPGPRGVGALLDLLGVVPAPLKRPAARLAGHPRLFNLTVSNIPGPRERLYMLGAELVSAHPVVPVTEGHALSVGLFSYRDAIHVGLYADPGAFPQVHDLARAVERHAAALARPDRGRRDRTRSVAVTDGDRDPAAVR